MRWAAYAGVSATLAAGVLVKALSQRPNFYSAAVYLAQSSANLMILTNFIFICACMVLLGLQKLLYGPLRPVEIEQLYERGWLFVTETCLSMTIFRGSFGAWFMVMFFSLLSGKVWGWIGEGRVEILEQQPPANPRLFHSRLATSLSLSVLFAGYMLDFSIRTVLAQAKPDMMVMFGFEFAILFILATSTAARYAICLTEIYILRKQKTARVAELRAERIGTNNATGAEEQGRVSNTDGEQTALAEVDEAEIEVEGWEGKGRWIFYLDLVTDFLKLTVYIAFFSVLLGFYGLPLHIMRDLYLSFRSFFKRVADFVRYRNATRDMHARYPDATQDDVGRDDVCIICREEMRPIPQNEAGEPSPRTSPVAERMRPKKLPCGHVLHFSCLRSWLERQQSCPTCRRPVIVTQGGQARADHHPAVPGNVAGGDGGPVPAHAPDQPGRNRARVLNFGPLRIGFGAGGGNLIEDLAQRIHNGEQRPPGDQPGQVDGPQHYGFGFGFGRRPNPRNPSPLATTTTTIQAQLGQIERSLQQQINSLQVAANELHLVRTLNDELLRLRSLQASGPNNEATIPQLPFSPPVFPFPLLQGQLPPIPPQSGPAILSSHAQQSLSSESLDLPEGVTLPPGWTLMPLQRSDGHHRATTSNGGTPFTLSITGSAASDAHSPHVSAQTHPSTSFTEPLASTSPAPTIPLADSSPNRTYSSSVEVNAPTPQGVRLPIPSWGSGSSQVNGEDHVDQLSDASPIRNGHQESESSTSVTDPSKEMAENSKGKGKAVTVEEVDDVD